MLANATCRTNGERELFFNIAHQSSGRKPLLSSIFALTPSKKFASLCPPDFDGVGETKNNSCNRGTKPMNYVGYSQLSPRSCRYQS